MKKLTAYNEVNEREISIMMGKAMCAYANWQRSIDSRRFYFKSNVSEIERVKIRAANQSEYEATVRCIGMFVKESIYDIQLAVIESAKEELGI